RVRAPLIAAVGLGPAPKRGDGAGPQDAQGADGAARAAERREANRAAETLRRASGSAVRALAGCGSVTLVLPLGDEPDADAVRAVAEGSLLGAYRFAGYKTRPQPSRRDPVRSVAVHVPDAADTTIAAEIGRAERVARAVTRVRDWVNTAPNELRPPVFADAIATAAREAGLTVEVLDEQALREGGYGGLTAVGQGSSAPPRLVRIAYTPAGTPAKRIALVGKGITFDTGGVSIKPAQGMWEMKSDMAGAAAVAATMTAVAQLRPEVAGT